VAIWLLLTLGFVSGISGVLVYQDVGGDVLEELHDVSSYAMLAVVGVHVLGVLLSSLMHRENLVRAMITGYKSDGQNVGIKRSYTWLGAIMLAAVVAFWLGYTATGQGSSGAGATHTEQHDDD
jgi:cytochrome b